MTRKASKRTSTKKTPRRKKSGRTAAKRKPAGRKAAARRAGGAKKKAAGRGRAPAIDAVARKIVRMTKDPSKLDVEELYAEDCVSWEPNMDEPSLGHEGRRAKDEYWESFQDSSKAEWSAKNVFTKGNTICIEWEATIVTRDGRSLTLPEVAIHEVKNGKIVSERYYFNPEKLQAGAQPAAAAEPRRDEPPTYRSYRAPGSSYAAGHLVDSDEDDDPTVPKVDPIDL